MFENRSIMFERRATHLADLQRLRHGGLRLNRLGFAQGKRHWIRRRFRNAALSFVTTGHGEIHCEGRTHRLSAPFILFCREGEYYSYGPDEAWDELYLVFDESSDVICDWVGCGIPAFWSPSDEKELRPLFEPIFGLMGRVDVPGVVDLLDHYAELLLITSLTELAKPDEQPVFAAALWMREHFAERFTIDAVAERFGFSIAQFRRTWKREVGGTPHGFLLELRMREAAQLLENPDLRIGEVAALCGYPDQRYFSTAFKRFHGCSPNQFRTNQR